MKKIKTLLLVVMAAVMSVAMAVGLAACNSKTVSYAFTGTYAPSTSGVDPVNFELNLYDDNTLELTPGIIFTLSTDNELLVDGTSTGTWSISGTTLSFIIESAEKNSSGESSYSRSYTVEQRSDGTYSFNMYPSLMGFTSQTITMSTGVSSADNSSSSNSSSNTEESPSTSETETPSEAETVATFSFSNSTGSMAGTMTLLSDGTMSTEYNMVTYNMTMYTATGTWTTDANGNYVITVDGDDYNEAKTLTSVEADGAVSITWSFSYYTSQGVQNPECVYTLDGYVAEITTVATFSFSNSTGSMAGTMTLLSDGTMSTEYNMVTYNMTMYTATGTWTTDENGNYVITVNGDDYNEAKTLTSVEADEAVTITWSFSYYTSQGVQNPECVYTLDV